MPPVDELNDSRGHTRRSFLTRFSLGLAAIAGAGFLFKNFLLSGSERASSSSDEFPGDESIYHPRRDPRLEAQERRERTQS